MAQLERRYELPRTTGDRLALAVFVCGGLFLLWYEACHILPKYYPTEWPTIVYIHYIFAVFFAVNIYGNMFMLATTDVQGKGVVMPGGSPPQGWKYCSSCQSNCPPRSHHCKLCNVCILKRDHHCWFAGYCIGYHNHRYFLVMITYIVMAGAYCNVFNLEFVRDVKGGFGIWNVLSFLGPHVGIVLGYMSVYNFVITLLSTIGMALFVLFTWILVLQILQIRDGQTQYEKKKQINEYNLGWNRNLRDVLGHRWQFVWISPLISSRLPGDGIKFETTPSKTL